jgi:hypothetical protein
MTAKIDGQVWSPLTQYVTAQTVPNAPGTFLLQGSVILSASDALTIQITLYNVAGTGTYALGVGPTVFGGSAAVSKAVGSWGTQLTGSAGTITLTALTPTRIAGTFEFSATPLVGPVTGTKSVTDGQFDLALQSGGSLPPLPDNRGSRIRASFGGNVWNAATVVSQIASDTLILSSSNDDSSLSMSLGALSGPGTYPLSDTAPVRWIQVVPQSGGTGWGPGAGTSGTVTITSLTATRVVGTFTATLAPAGGAAGSPLVITSGEFDVGLP